MVKAVAAAFADPAGRVLVAATSGPAAAWRPEPGPLSTRPTEALGRPGFSAHSQWGRRDTITSWALLGHVDVQ